MANAYPDVESLIGQLEGLQLRATLEDIRAQVNSAVLNYESNGYIKTEELDIILDQLNEYNIPPNGTGEIQILKDVILGLRPLSGINIPMDVDEPFPLLRQSSISSMDVNGALSRQSSAVPMDVDEPMAGVVAQANEQVAESIPLGVSYGPTGNLWAFVSDITTNENIALTSLPENKSLESLMLYRFFVRSIIQNESMGLLDGNNDLRLRRYGVVINQINFIRGMDIVRSAMNDAPVGIARPKDYHRALTENDLGNVVLPNPAQNSQIPVGGLYFNCRMVDLAPRNNNSELRYSPNILLSANNNYVYPNGLPNATQITGLHLTIHGANHPNQSHISFTLGQTYVITQRIYFRLSSIMNEQNQIEDRITICNMQGNSILNTCTTLSNMIMQRYINIANHADNHHPPILQLTADDINIIRNTARRNEHKLAIRNAFYHFLMGVENYLSNLRNLNRIEPDMDNIMVSLAHTHRSNVTYKKYIKYKTKYMRLKELMDRI